MSWRERSGDGTWKSGAEASVRNLASAASRGIKPIVFVARSDGIIGRPYLQVQRDGHCENSWFCQAWWSDAYDELQIRDTSQSHYQ